MKQTLLLTLILFILSSCSDPESGNGKGKATSREASSPGNERIEDLTSRILANPNNPNLYVSRALAYSDQEMYNLALKDIDRALTIDSTVSFIHASKGELFFKTGDLRSARLSLERSVAYDPDNTEALLKLGEVNYLLRRYPEAVTRIDQALRVNDRLAQGYFLKGFIFKEVGDTSLSLSSFQTATEVNPEFYEAFMELAHLYAYRGNPLAVEYINTALELRPYSAEAYYHLGLFHQSKGDIGRAMDAYSELVRRDPSSYLGFYNLGYIYLTEILEFDTAFAYFDTVLSLQPAAIDARYNQGLCYEEFGQSDRAVQVYKEVLEANPQHTLSAMGLERLLE